MANSGARRRRVYEACSVERYTLDLRRVTLTRSYQFLVGTRLIPLRRGQNYSDFEIIMDELPIKIVAILVKNIKERERGNGRNLRNINELLKRMPVGIDVTTLPPGAAIVRGYIE